MRPCTVPNARAIARPATMFLLTSLVLACSDANGPAPVVIDSSVSGQVTSAATGHDVSGADVSAGGDTQTTDASGRFVLRHVPDGPATLHVVAAGFEKYDAPITVVNGSARHDPQLARIEAFAVDDFALYVPKTIDVAYGVLLALGGPDTRAFATGVPAGAPIPEVEASLQTLGQDLRTLAAEKGL
ncbi:MAG TPA: carboxypeptidase regulatory-like domain-containing protein, partial [Tepidiformaceae bacterium]|nr:carboxypeptidase regulatory-like domain-containing protein [Tepidiformaceae bacterium]